MERSEYENIDQYHIAHAESLARNMPEQFSDGCRVLFLIQRHKDGGHTNNSKLRAYISRGRDEWILALAKLMQEKKWHPGLELRIYQTLNARDIDKGIRHFKHAALDADYYDTDSRQWFYLDVRNRIISALMKPPCKAESYFMFDVDTKDPATMQRLFQELEKLTTVVHHYETKNGWHVISKPFNPNLIKLPVDGRIGIHKDGMMLLAY